MRLVLTGAAACALAGCAGAPARDDTQPVARACTVSDCFYERDIRAFEVIDKTTLIVYVGSQRCPFEMKLQGFACDMTFAPFIAFHSRNPIDESGRDVFGQPIGAGLPAPGRSTSQRVCSNDIGLGVDGGIFSDTADDVTQTASPRSVRPRTRNPGEISNDLKVDKPITRSQCQILSVASMTDDQLVDLLVSKKHMPPPPPIGKAEVEVPAQNEEPEPGALPKPGASGEDAAAGTTPQAAGF